MWGPPMGIACKVYDQGAEAHPDLDDRNLQACLRARLAQQRRRLARQRRRERRQREEAAGREQEQEGDGSPDRESAEEEEEEGEGDGGEEAAAAEPLFVFAPAHAGWLIKRGSGGLRIWRRRWVGLDASRRLWYARGPPEKGRAGAEGAIGCMELTQWSRVIEDAPGGDPLAFRVVPGGAEDELRAVAVDDGGEEEDGGFAAVAAEEEEEPQESSDSAGAARSSSSEGEEAPAGAAGAQREQQQPQRQHHRRGSSGGTGIGGVAPPPPPPPPGEGWLFRAESAQEKAAWVARLKECIALSRWWAGLRFGPALGEGGFSQVFEMVDMARGERLAVKVMAARSRMERDQCVAETEILASIGEEIRHPHLMAPRRVYVEGNRAWLMFPLCRGGDLFHRLHARGRMAEPAAAVLMHRLLGAVAALHAHGILHLDIKPENVLFASPGPESVEPYHVRLTDFGLSRRVHPRRRHNHHRRHGHGHGGPLAGCGGSAASLLSVRSEEGEGEEEGGDDVLLEQDWDYLARLRYNLEFDSRLNGTIGYMSPEVVLHKRYGPAADVWSLGVVLHILLVGRSPWQPPRPDATPKAGAQASSSPGWDGDVDDGSGSGADPHRAILARSVKGHYSTKGPEWARVSEGARDLVRRMLCVDDAARISTGEALAHPWLAEAAAAMAAEVEAAAMAAAGGGRRAGGAGRQQQPQRLVGAGRGRGGEAGDGEWVHTPSGEGGAGAIRSLLDAVWCRGSSFVARLAGGGGAGAGAAKATHSGSGTEATSSISSAVSS